jgi:high-affinity Fe2+/Pb2+ permease
MDAWKEKMKRGPTGLIIYNPQGVDPMMSSQMVIGLILDILSAALIAWFLSRSTAITASYFTRVMYCAMFALFVTVFNHLINWNWMGFPMDFTTSMILDSIVGCLLAGLGIAAIVKPPTQEAASQ